MIRIRQFFRSVDRLRNKQQMGDAAILKADAVGARAAPEVEAKLEAVRGYLPSIDVEALRRLPPGTFGHEYAVYLERNQLMPFTVSPDLGEEVRRNVFAVRYAVTHDIFHLLLGFDTTLAGEIGVLAFAAAQGYSRSLRVGLWLARLLYPLMAPRQTRQIRENRRRGWELGARAGFLLGFRFEEAWGRPLAELKAELGLAG